MTGACLSTGWKANNDINSIADMVHLSSRSPFLIRPASAPRTLGTVHFWKEPWNLPPTCVYARSLQSGSFPSPLALIPTCQALLASPPWLFSPTTNRRLLSFQPSWCSLPPALLDNPATLMLYGPHEQIWS